MQFLNITSKIRNINRFSFIVTIFAQHGLQAIFSLLKFGDIRNLIKDTTVKVNPSLSPAERLVKAFETLGPTFIKLGQLLSMREDALPIVYTKELSKLQEQAKAVPYSAIKSIIESEFQQPLEDVLNYLNPQPIASASIGQVHQATLIDNTQVVVKIQRPQIDSIVEADMAILYGIAQWLEKIPEFAVYKPVSIVDELNLMFINELNYLKEASNTELFHKLLDGYQGVKIPSIYWKLTTKKVLTMEEIKGKSLTALLQDPSFLELKNLEDIQKEISQKLFTVYFKQIFIEGVFQADLHFGNILVSDQFNLCMVDFGNVIFLSSVFRKALVNMFHGFLNEDYELFADELLAICEAPNSLDYQSFQNRVREVVEPLYLQPLADVNFGLLMLNMLKIATQYKINVPPQIVFLARTIANLEIFVRKLNPDFNFISECSKLAAKQLKPELNPRKIMSASISLLQDVNSLLRVLPRQLKQASLSLNRGKISLHVSNEYLPQILDQFRLFTKYIGGSLQLLGLLIASSVLLCKDNFNVPMSFSEWRIFLTNGQHMLGFILIVFSLIWLIQLVFQRNNK